jgi:hypothetical protein
MSSFFGDLTSGGIKMPEAIFDQSSMLPPLNTAGYGGGFDGTPDARINQGSSLFSDMEPYAYGKGARLSTQTAYLANPHNIQKIVPQLRLPECNRSNDHSNFTLPHSVSDGDVAFSIRFASSKVRTELMNNAADYFRQGAGRAVDYVCNIATINYIMRGLFTEKKFLNPAWSHFACALGWEAEYKAIQALFAELRRLRAQGKNVTFPSDEAKLRLQLRSSAEHLVRDHFRPIGVVIGADKQGGQHEVGQKTVTWPVAYIVTISIDGRNENLCNYWRHLDVSSGGDLGFFVQMKKQDSYALNYSKQITKKVFANFRSEDQDNTQITDEYPQLCPGTMDTIPSEDRKLSGHWHFCMSQAMHHKLTSKPMFNDVTAVHVGALMLSTISIVWVRKWNPDKKYVRNGVTPYDDSVRYHGDDSDIRHPDRYAELGKIRQNWANVPHYATHNQRVTQGKIAITLSTHNANDQRCQVKPRPLTDQELVEMGALPRSHAKRTLPDQSSIQMGEPPLSKAKRTDIASMEPADSYVSTSTLKTGATTQVKVTTTKLSSKKKNTEGSGSVL